MLKPFIKTRFIHFKYILPLETKDATTNSTGKYVFHRNAPSESWYPAEMLSHHKHCIGVMAYRKNKEVFEKRR
jgi:hypothetical protein